LPDFLEDDAVVAATGGPPASPARAIHHAQGLKRRDDATLANPFGPPHLGWAQVAKATTEAAANFTGGSIRFADVSRFTTPDLGSVVELESIEVQVAGSEEMTLRCRCGPR
jgi:hypothetical protein